MPISNGIITTCLILHRSPFCRKNSSDPLRHSLHNTSEGGLWYFRSRSLKSCMLRDGASVDQTYLSSTSHKCSVGLTSREFGGQANTSNSLQYFGINLWCPNAIIHSFIHSFWSPLAVIRATAILMHMVYVTLVWRKHQGCLVRFR